MRLVDLSLGLVALTPAASGCAKGAETSDASCGASCDTDRDGVVDGSDLCPDTPAGEVVNEDGCADSQVSPTLEDFPPFGLTWTPTGDLGRAGGLTWAYAGIDRADLFHIYWIVCDDPATPCGLSLDGPIDAPAEGWQPSAADSDFPAGRLVFTNATNILLADTTTVPLSGRLTITIIEEESGAPLPFDTVANLGVTARSGTHGAVIPRTTFTVTALAEVEDTATAIWTPYLDYYDAAPTGDPGGTSVSFGASFYSE